MSRKFTAVVVCVVVLFISIFVLDRKRQAEDLEEQRQVQQVEKEQQRQAQVEQAKKAIEQAAPPTVASQAKLADSESLPRYSVDELFNAFQARHGEDALVGKKIVLTGKIEVLGDDDVSLVASQGFLISWFDVTGFGDKELNALKKGDTVEVVCKFTGRGERMDQAGDNFAAHKYYFKGIEIR